MSLSPLSSLTSLKLPNSYQLKCWALLLLVFGNLFWAGDAIAARWMSSNIPPFSLAFYRWSLAFLILAPFALPHLRGQWSIVRGRFFVIVVLGLLGVSLYNGLLYLAAHSTTAVNITLVGSSLPVVTLLMAWMILQQRPNLWQWVGVLASLVGILVIVCRGDISAFLSLQFQRGDVLILGIVFAWSLYSIILRKYPVALHPIALLWVLVAAGMPFLLLMWAFEVATLPPVEWNNQSLAVLVYIAIFPSILSYLCWGYGIKHLGPSITALSSYLMPIFTALLAVSLLGEALHIYHAIGATCILLGLYFGVVKR